jgi:hypothetical protein
MAEKFKIETDAVKRETAPGEGERWSFSNPEQMEKHLPHFKAIGMVKGDQSALSDAANEMRKQRKS